MEKSIFSIYNTLNQSSCYVSTNISSLIVLRLGWRVRDLRCINKIIVHSQTLHFVICFKPNKIKSTSWKAFVQDTKACFLVGGMQNVSVYRFYMLEPTTIQLQKYVKPPPLLLLPGTGCLLQAVETAAQRQAQTVGKPNHYMFDCVASQFGVERERCLMVGDRLDTDIMLGSNCGLKTLLTLTGVSTVADAEAHQKSGCPERQGMVPDYYVESIADLLPALQG